MFGHLKQTFKEWSEDKVSLLAAGLAYYTLFSVAPLLLIVIGVLGLVLGENAAQSNLMEQIRTAIGPQAADAIQSILENTGRRENGVVATVLGSVALVLGATTVLAQLQIALNVIWGVRPDPKKTGPLRLLTIRILSFGMILVIGFLLLVSMLLSAFLHTLWQDVAGPQALWQAVDFLISLGVIALLFALIFKVVPDARIAWQDAWVGAAFTATLFVIGRFLVSLYIGRSGVASAYGAAGSLVILLLWVYYSAQILLLGGEFTQVYARRRGERLEPAEHAVHAEEI